MDCALAELRARAEALEAAGLSEKAELTLWTRSIKALGRGGVAFSVVRPGGSAMTLILSIPWIAGWLLITNGSTALGVALMLPLLAHCALIAFDVWGAAAESARVATRLRSRGDQVVVTTEDAQVLGRFVLVTGVVLVAVFAIVIH